MNLTLDSVIRGKVAVLSVRGKIDQLSAEEFHRLLSPHLATCGVDGQALVIDLSGVDYISSAGLRIFMLASREVKPRQGRIALAGLQPVVSEIFEISKFSLLFPIHPRVEDALT